MHSPARDISHHVAFTVTTTILSYSSCTSVLYCCHVIFMPSDWPRAFGGLSFDITFRPLRRPVSNCLVAGNPYCVIPILPYLFISVICSTFDHRSWPNILRFTSQKELDCLSLL